MRVEVADPGADTAGSKERLTSEGGWGLVLVDQLSERWGRERTPAGGSVAWFELSLVDRAASPRRENTASEPPDRGYTRRSLRL